MTKAHPIEADVKKGIKKIFDKHDIFWWCPPANTYGRTGISDFHAIWRGNFIAVEAKLDVKVKGPTDMQKAFLTSIQSSGGMAFVVDAERLPFLDEFLTLWEIEANAVERGQPETPENAARMIDLVRALTWEVV